MAQKLLFLQPCIPPAQGNVQSALENTDLAIIKELYVISVFHHKNASILSKSPTRDKNADL